MSDKSDILQGTLDLMVLKTLDAMGAMHGYGIARRIEQLSGEALQINQGTIYLCLIRLVQQRWIKAEWGTSDNNRRAKFYSITADRPEAAGGQGQELGARRRRDRPPAAARSRQRLIMLSAVARLVDRLRALFRSSELDADFAQELQRPRRDADRRHMCAAA